LSVFARQIITLPTYFHGSASVLYKPLYRPLFFSIVLDSIMFGSNKGYRSCAPIISTLHKYPTFWGLLCSTAKLIHKFRHKMGWATFWANFSQTHLVTLTRAAENVMGARAHKKYSL
jgi:hypothetical protein